VPHIDGVYSPGNGVPPGKLSHFTALIGVFLSDVPAADRGNFTVWPGSHRLLAEHVRQHGRAAIATSFPALPLPAPRAILARAGDAVLAHYQLAHGIAPNLGPHIRYAVFFRLYHVAHEARGDEPLGDLWCEWEGMAGL
jgi:ectoine hydroxylase-related dioxygenase (phytanoyl-CoA dioxygenase family)